MDKKGNIRCNYCEAIHTPLQRITGHAKYADGWYCNRCVIVFFQKQPKEGNRRMKAAQEKKASNIDVGTAVLKLLDTITADYKKML